MPVEAIHLSAFLDSLASSRAQAALARAATRELGRLGALVIDFPYFDQFPKGVVRHLLKRPVAVSEWGEALHHGRPVRVATSMIARARSLREAGHVDASERVLALALGFVSHLAVDAALHPLVNRMARARAARLGDSPLRQHSEVEKFHSILFHEERLGFDFMGKRALREHISVCAHAIHRDAEVREAFREGVDQALGSAPSEVELRRWAAGYTQYVWLLSSPAGKTLMSDRMKRTVREEVYDGPWGTFGEAYTVAVDASRSALDATLAWYEDPACEPAFHAAVPSGAIDDLQPAELGPA